MVSRLFLCLVNRHRPIRAEVFWNGRNHCSHCRDCGAPVRKVRRRRWVRATRAELGAAVTAGPAAEE